MAEEILLQAPDYVVTSLMLLIPIGIGIFFAIKDSKNATRDEYLLGGRRMAMLPVALSLFVTFISAIALMGTPADMYYYGLMSAMLYVGFCLSYLVGVFTLVPLMYPLHLTSLYEYLSLRFESQALRMFIVGMGMIQTVCYMAIALLTPALGLQAAAGLPLWVSVVIVGVIGTLYTALGGLKSVIWSDAFQCFIMFAGVVAVIAKGSQAVGGGDSIFTTAEAGGRFDMNAFNPDPRKRHTWWGTIIGGNFIWLVNIFSQSMIQRVSSMKTIKDARKLFLINIPIVICFATLLCICGIVIYAYFSFLRCDPLGGGLIKSRNQITSYFVMHVLQDLPGLAGLYMATLFSAGLSTISSGINSLAAITVEDIFKKPLLKVKETTATFITKVIVCVYGIAIIALAYGASSLKGQLTQMVMSIFGACGGPIFGTFFLGASIPSANKYGASAGVIIALVFNIWMAVGSQMYGKQDRMLVIPPTDMCINNLTTGTNNATSLLITLSSPSNLSFTNYTPPVSQGRDPYAYNFFIYDVSYEWYGFIGSLLSFSIGVLVSLFTARFVKSSPNPKYIFPFARKIWSLPEPIHTKSDESNYDIIENVKLAQRKLEEFKHSELTIDVNEEKSHGQLQYLLKTNTQYSEI